MNEKYYSFERVFLEDAPQSEVYSELREHLLRVFQGKNVCLFAYGATGTGKTYTVRGRVSLSPESRSTQQKLVQTEDSQVHPPLISTVGSGDEFEEEKL